MCIRYSKEVHDAIINSGKEWITVYKVYYKNTSPCVSDGQVSSGYLSSPYNSFMAGGCITKPGELTAHNNWGHFVSPPNAIGRALPRHKEGVVNKRMLRSGGKRYDDVQLHVYGFHCFLKRSGALRFLSNIRGNVVVPVRVRTSDLIIGGRENAGYDCALADSATFKKITITKRAWDAVFSPKVKNEGTTVRRRRKSVRSRAAGK